MKYTEGQALAKIAAYCSKAERAESDVRRKLTLWELDSDETERIINRLQKENFLNEERFCRCFIKDKLQFNKWGKRKIIFELKKKHIAEQIISNCFMELESEDFEDALLKVLISKEKIVKYKDDFDKKNKLIRFALGRGYSYEQVQRCLSKILKTDIDDELYME